MSFPLDLRVLGTAEALLKPSGLTLSQVAVLDVLSQHEALSSSEIAQALAMAPATVTRCTQKLVGLHMVRVSLDDRDLRRNVFRLEVRGHAVLFEIRKSLAEAGTLEGALRAHRVLSQVAGCKRGAKVERARSSLSPSSARLLLALDAGPCAAGEAAARAGLGQSTASMALAALEANGLAAPVKTEVPDGRQHRYALTRQGRAQAASLTAALKALSKYDE